IFRHVAQSGPLRAALESGATKGWELAARDLCLKRTAPLLRDEVFRELLRTGVMSSPELERLLIALRRLLVLELPPERFADHDLVQFAVTLMQQCWLNEYVWKASEEELRAIAAKRLVIADLLNGSVEQGFTLLLVSLYVPTLQPLGPGVTQQMVGNIRPNALRDAVAARVRELVDEQGRRIPLVGDLADPTSRKVALQYEGAPYPRWRRLSITPQQE